MNSGKRYVENHSKLNIIKVLIAILIIIAAIFGIYKLTKKEKKIEAPKELGREIAINKTGKKDKTIDDYLEEYKAVLIEKVKDDTYYVSVDGVESTLYSDGTLANGELHIWNGESKELEIKKDANTLTINTPEELKWFADQIISGERNFSGFTVSLNNNIDLGGRIHEDLTLEGTRWNSIVGFLGNQEGSEEENLKGFAGTFEGNNHWIKGIIVESNDKYQGLFGYLHGTIKNLTIKDSYIVGKEGVGAFCGLNEGKIENCKIKNVIVKGESKIGGIAGINLIGSEISGSSTNNEQCEISGNENVGGIVGYLNNNSSVINCENKSPIKGENYIGGIAGVSFFGTNITDCINSKDISGKENIGGISGYSQSIIEKCKNQADISGNKYIGGIVGINYETGNISSSFNTGSIEAKEDFVGGISGINNATIVSTYNTGTITILSENDNISIGGISGQNLSESAISNSYNIGILNSKYAGGIIGANYGVMANCYYLDTTANIKTKEAKTEEEMKTINLDEDFREDTDNVNDGYFILNWQ